MDLNKNNLLNKNLQKILNQQDNLFIKICIQKKCSKQTPSYFYLHFELLHSKPSEHKQLDEQKPNKVPEFAGQLVIFNVL
jgi:hypothetical protein